MLYLDINSEASMDFCKEVNNIIEYLTWSFLFRMNGRYGRRQ
jgi:hypothetical protein